MRRKTDSAPTHSVGRGRSLISTRTSQQQQRKMQGNSNRPRVSELPRSYSTPAPQNQRVPSSPVQARQDKGYVARSFSSPDPKPTDYRRNSDFFYRPRSHGSRSEIDSDLENFEQFEEMFIDTDPQQDHTIFGSYRYSPEVEEPKKVTAALLPGSPRLQRVAMNPVSSTSTQTFRNTKDVMKDIHRAMPENKGFSRLNFRPLTVKMPIHNLLPDIGTCTPSMEELQNSPQLEMETEEMNRELDSGEQQLEAGVAMATEESDEDTVSNTITVLTNDKVLQMIQHV